MTPERLREIETLFHSARERTPDERDAFLARACAGDSALRREVESLLAQQPRHDRPLLVGTAEVMLNTTLHHYRIVRALGRGGMGEVYAADDTKLHRQVAIKILPRTFKEDPDRLARFEREARVLASLNHPHIGAIFGLEEADDVIGLVMELVEGDDLSHRVGRGAIPIPEALSIAR